MTKILLVEDEAAYRDPLKFKLERDGYEVVAVETGTDALAEWNPQFDVVILDLMLPGLSGVEVCKAIRARSNTPIIMVTAKDSEVDKVVGLEIGADDYVTKPYSYRELVARINAIMRRIEAEYESAEKPVLRVGQVEMDVDRHEVTVRGEPIALPLREFELLEFFMRNAGRVLTRGQIIDRVWGSNYVGDTKTLDVHVKRVRSKIESEPARPELITTVRGLGYKMVPPSKS
ncbi:MAG TPA: response regulator transcription factor [Actinomycetaceae bacterium]|nr:response regulator transcription factor [Actinomycetaceae bacterium]